MCWLLEFGKQTCSISEHGKQCYNLHLNTISWWNLLALLVLTLSHVLLPLSMSLLSGQRHAKKSPRLSQIHPKSVPDIALGLPEEDFNTSLHKKYTFYKLVSMLCMFCVLRKVYGSLGQNIWPKNGILYILYIYKNNYFKCVLTMYNNN